MLGIQKLLSFKIKHIAIYNKKINIRIRPFMTKQNLTILHLSDFHLSHNNIDKELYDKMLYEIKNWMKKRIRTIIMCA